MIVIWVDGIVQTTTYNMLLKRRNKKSPRPSIGNNVSKKKTKPNKLIVYCSSPTRTLSRKNYEVVGLYRVYGPFYYGSNLEPLNEENFRRAHRVTVINDNGTKVTCHKWRFRL